MAKKKVKTSSNVIEHLESNTSTISQIYLTGGEIVDFMGAENSELCKDINTKSISIKKQIGKGKMGVVYDISLNGVSSNKKYVLKKSTTDIKIEKVPTSSITLKKKSLGEFFDLYLKRDYPTISRSIFIKINGGNENKLISSFKSVTIPIYADLCRTTEQLHYRTTNNNSQVIPAGSYVCDNVAYSEYILSLIVSDFYRTGKSINFIEMFGFATCKNIDKSILKLSKKESYSQYIFMEKISFSLRKLVEKTSLTENDVRSIVIQTIFAIGCMETYGNISHNDLHPDNIFLEVIDESTLFQGKSVHSSDFFHYSFNGENIFFPRGRYIVKLGDFGFGVKWSAPIVAPLAVIEDLSRGWMPNFYSETYDTAYFILSMLVELQVSTDDFGLVQPVQFIERLLDFCTHGIEPEIFFNIERGNRPKMDRLHTLAAKPLELLEHIIDEYNISEPEGEYITIGTIASQSD